MKKNCLFLYQEIMLLALRDEKGTMVSGARYSYAVGGAVLAELMLQGRIEVEQEKKKRYAKVTSSHGIGDPLIDECLAKVADAKRRAQLQTWVSRFASVKKLKQKSVAELCRRGILRVDEDKVLGIFTRKIYPELDPRSEKELTERLRKAIFTQSKNLDPRTVVTVSLANSSGLLKANFDKKKLKERKERIKSIVNGELTGKATADAIQAMQAAIMAAVILPMVFSSATR